jgi:hypothetical protein
MALLGFAVELVGDQPAVSSILLGQQAAAAQQACADARRR